MEHAQRDTCGIGLPSLNLCLNPYFNGTCSKSKITVMVQVKNIVES